MSDALPDLAAASTPADVRSDMTSLRAALDAVIPQKRDTLRNLLIATWNIREFSGLSEKWISAANDSPKRDWRGLWAIVEIISRFDVIAVQEAGGNLKSLRTLMKTLGPAWNFIMTDTTAGSAGGGERLAYVFDTRRVQLSGLACELVVPPEWLAETGPDVLRQQFARTPYAVGFRSGRATFVLTTLHVIYGATSQDRIGEVTGVARWMQDWARRTTEWEQNFIVLGDFNIDRRNDPLYQAFVSRGLTVAPQHRDLPRTIFDPAGHPDQSSFYDQIAWFSEANKPLLNMALKSGGNFDFRPHVYKGVGLTLQQLSFRLSDHYPLWLEFETGA
jgi:endonuclease/exonuclease/phosphatase family metal-dependent hydrolase